MSVWRPAEVASALRASRFPALGPRFDDKQGEPGGPGLPRSVIPAGLLEEVGAEHFRHSPAKSSEARGHSPYRLPITPFGRCAATRQHHPPHGPQNQEPSDWQ